MHHEAVMKSIIPVVMAGVLGIYGLIVAVILIQAVSGDTYSDYNGDARVRANAQQEKLFVGMILILIFAEALGLYGLIVALILSQSTQTCKAPTS